MRILIDVDFKTGKYPATEIIKKIADTVEEAFRDQPDDKQHAVIVIKDYLDGMYGHQFTWDLMILVTDQPRSAPSDVVATSPFNIGMVALKYLRNSKTTREALKA